MVDDLPNSLVFLLKKKFSKARFIITFYEKTSYGPNQNGEEFSSITFDLNQGFGNFLNCTERKSPFENESAISPAISDPMLK